MKRWDEMTDAERDTAVAIHVLGDQTPSHLSYDAKSQRWGHYRDGVGSIWWFEEVWPYLFSTNAAADYAVLRHVRDEWGLSAQSDNGWSFQQNLMGIWTRRLPRGVATYQLMACLYEPGDYSHAAYETARGVKVPAT